MAATVLGAIHEVWAADTALGQLVPSGLWSLEVPEEMTLPLVVLKHDSEEPEDTSEVEYIETTRVHFEVYASEDVTATAGSPVKPTETAEKIGLAIKQAIDRQVLAVDDADFMGAYRGRVMVSMEKKKGPRGERVVKVYLPWRFALSRRYPRLRGNQT